MIKCLLVSIAFVFSSKLLAESYFLMASVVDPESSPQPTFIALGKGSRLYHYPARQSLIPVDTGTYRLRHVDFGTVSMGRAIYFRSDKLKFEALEDSIVYVGLLVVDKGIEEASVNVVFDPRLLEWACENNPEILKRMPVTFVEDGIAVKEIKVDC
ncbi:MAG: hypothetical protein AAF699_05865 [Pseudomonadota bacterium]